jgi:hypothetical protein
MGRLDAHTKLRATFTSCGRLVTGGVFWLPASSVRHRWLATILATGRDLKRAVLAAAAGRDPVQREPSGSGTSRRSGTSHKSATAT